MLPQRLGAELGPAAAQAPGPTLALHGGHSRMERQVLAAMLYMARQAAAAASRRPRQYWSARRGVAHAQAPRLGGVLLCPIVFYDALPGRPDQHSVDAQLQRPEGGRQGGQRRHPHRLQRRRGRFKSGPHGLLEGWRSSADASRDATARGGGAARSGGGQWAAAPLSGGPTQGWLASGTAQARPGQPLRLPAGGLQANKAAPCQSSRGKAVPGSHLAKMSEAGTLQKQLLRALPGPVACIAGRRRFPPATQPALRTFFCSFIWHHNMHQFNGLRSRPNSTFSFARRQPAVRARCSPPALADRHSPPPFHSGFHVMCDVATRCRAR